MACGDAGIQGDNAHRHSGVANVHRRQPTGLCVLASLQLHVGRAALHPRGDGGVAAGAPGPGGQLRLPLRARVGARQHDECFGGVRPHDGAGFRHDRQRCCAPGHGARRLHSLPCPAGRRRLPRVAAAKSRWRGRGKRGKRGTEGARDREGQLCFGNPQAVAKSSSTFSLSLSLIVRRWGGGGRCAGFQLPTAHGGGCALCARRDA